MKKILPVIALILMLVSCSTQEELSYLNNLQEVGGENSFAMEVPDYQVQPRDIIYVSVKAQTPEGALTEMLNDRLTGSGAYIQGEAQQYVLGYSIDPSGLVTVPLFGAVPVSGMTIYADT